MAASAVLTSPDGLVSLTVAVTQDNIPSVSVYVVQLSAFNFLPPSSSAVRLAVEKGAQRVWEGHARTDGSVG